jgi:tRNA A37 methylthiotransferase MiaB
MMGVFAYSPEPGTAMGRMSDQIADDVKTARVEELMLAQQQVAFKKASSMIGRDVEVLIDRADSDGGWVARHAGQAPDIDSLVHVSGNGLHPGQLINVRVIDSRDYDLIARVPKKRSRPLNVLAGAAH